MRTASIKSRPSDLSARANDQTEELDDTAMGILSSYLPNETTRSNIFENPTATSFFQLVSVV